MIEELDREASSHHHHHHPRDSLTTHDSTNLLRNQLKIGLIKASTSRCHPSTLAEACHSDTQLLIASSKQGINDCNRRDLSHTGFAEVVADGRRRRGQLHPLCFLMMLVKKSAYGCSGQFVGLRASRFGLLLGYLAEGTTTIYEITLLHQTGRRTEEIFFAGYKKVLFCSISPIKFSCFSDLDIIENDIGETDSKPMSEFLRWSKTSFFWNSPASRAIFM